MTKRGLIAVVTAVVVASAAVIAAVVYRARQDSSSASPAEVVSAYLRALSAGDTATALGLGAATPSSTTLLTDAVLKQQLEKLPVTDIHVDGEQATVATRPDRVYVKASAMFGGQRSEALIQVVRANDSWKLASPFLNAHAGPGGSPPGGSAYDTLEVFGQPIHDRTLAVFPGALLVSTSNPFLSVAQPAPLLLDRLRYGGQTASLTPAFSVNERGKQAIATTVVNWLTACLTPGSPPAGPCDKISQSLYGFGHTIQDGTARLAGPISLGQFTVNFDQSLRPVAIINSATIPLAGQSGVDGSPLTGNLPGLTTPVDISHDPPVVVAP